MCVCVCVCVFVQNYKFEKYVKNRADWYKSIREKKVRIGQ